MLKLYVEAHVRYWEDANVNGIDDEDGVMIPCRNGELWTPVIDIAKGLIEKWEQGKIADVHYKVCDAGSYYVRNAEGQIIKSIINDYVPSYLCPEGSGFGDYIIMHVDENGYIRNWDNSELLLSLD